MTIRTFYSCLAACAVLLTVTVRPAGAQTWTSPDPTLTPWKEARLKLGPIYFNPDFHIKNFGIDQNVFNDPKFPRRDLTGTMEMLSELGLHARDGFVVSVTQGTDYVWFRRYRSERSVDGTLKAMLEIRTHPLRPWITYDKGQTHERPNAEIDARAGRQTPTVEVGTDVHVGNRFGGSIAWRRERTKFAQGETFDGVDLGTVFNSTNRQIRAVGRYQLTDFTSLIGGVELVTDRFVLTPDRDADGKYYFGGVESNQEARFRGSLAAGYRVQKFLDPATPSYRGPVVHTNMTTVVMERTKVDFNLGRDVNYSYDINFAYYVANDAGLTLTSRVGDHLDLSASGTGEWMVYRVKDTTLAVPRTDRSLTYGVGFGYYVGGVDGTRFGLTIERAERVSPLADKNYQTTRVYSNVRLMF